MKEEFVPCGIYKDIINQLGQWKVLDMKGLLSLNNYDLKYHNLLHKVRRLEKYGLVKGVTIGKKNKHIFLTDLGIQFTPYDFTYEICHENLTHDLIVGMVVRKLLGISTFSNGKLFHQISEERIFPDAEITGFKDNSKYRMALEIELTQKSQGRIKEKFRRYGNGKAFDYVLFITNKESLLKTYRRFLLEMNSEIQEGVLLMLDKSLSVNQFDYEKSGIFYLGKEISFSKMFTEGFQIGFK